MDKLRRSKKSQQVVDQVTRVVVDDELIDSYGLEPDQSKIFKSSKKQEEETNW